MKNIIYNIKARWTAKPFNVYKECISSKKEADGYWLADDGFIYYGDRWLIFFKSMQNDWYTEGKFNFYKNLIN